MTAESDRRRFDVEFASRIGALETDADAGRSQRALIFSKLEDVREGQHNLKDEIIEAIGAAIKPLAARVAVVENDINEARTAIRVHRWYLGGAVAVAALFGPKLADVVSKKLGMN